MESSTATNSSFPAKLLHVNHCSCLTIKDFAVQAEMVAVESSLDVGNILWMFCDCLWRFPSGKSSFSTAQKVWFGDYRWQNIPLTMLTLIRFYKKTYWFVVCGGPRGPQKQGSVVKKVSKPRDHCGMLYFKESLIPIITEHTIDKVFRGPHGPRISGWGLRVIVDQSVLATPLLRDGIVSFNCWLLLTLGGHILDPCSPGGMVRTETYLRSQSSNRPFIDRSSLLKTCVQQDYYRTGLVRTKSLDGPPLPPPNLPPGS